MGTREGTLDRCNTAISREWGISHSTPLIQNCCEYHCNEKILNHDIRSIF